MINSPSRMMIMKRKKDDETDETEKKCQKNGFNTAISAPNVITDEELNKEALLLNQKEKHEFAILYNWTKQHHKKSFIHIFINLFKFFVPSFH